MPFKATITNLGPFVSATLLLNRFTVFFGQNDTGKSFALKLLYTHLQLPLPLMTAEQHLKHNFEVEDTSSLQQECGSPSKFEVENMRGALEWTDEGFKDNRLAFPFGAPPILLDFHKHAQHELDIPDRYEVEEDVSLYIDGPETHLHPKEQIERMQRIYNHSCLTGGNAFNIFLVTHSVDMLMWLKVYILSTREHHSGAIAINQFSRDPDGTCRVTNFPTFDIGIEAALKDLGTPFSELYIEGI